MLLRKINNLNFGLSSLDSEGFAPQILAFAGEMWGKTPRIRRERTKFRLQGQYHLDDILTHPKSYSKPNRFGGIDFLVSEGRRARFYQEGTFRGFLE